MTGRRTPAPSGSRKAILGAVGALVGIAAIALAITRPWQSPEPVVEDPPPPPVVTQGTVEIPQGTLPAGAVITLRDPAGQTRSVTESALPLDAGTYTVSFEAPGHEPDEQTLTVRAGETLQYVPVVRAVVVVPPPDDPPAVVEGTVEIVTANLPVGATITMRNASGQSRAVTGRTLSLAPGTYTFEFRAPRHEADRQTIVVRAGQSQRYVPVVQALPDDPPPVVEGTVEISANLPAGGAITLREPGGQTRVVTGRSVTLPAGTYGFEFRAPGHETDQQTIVVRARETLRYSPVIRAIPTRPDPPPTRDPSADQAAVEAAVRDFVNAFQRRDAGTVVPLLPAAQQAPWRTLLNERTVTEWQASLGSQDAPRFDGDGATATFVMRVSFRDGSNQTRRQELRYVGTFARGGGTWRLTSLRTN